MRDKKGVGSDKKFELRRYKDVKKWLRGLLDDILLIGNFGSALKAFQQTIIGIFTKIISVFYCQ